MSLDSPFSDKLRKNYIAQPEEEAGIGAVIEHHRTIVHELDVQEKEIDQAITALLERKGAVRGIRDTHQKFIDDHQSLLSSVLHLPEDVLSKIFMDSVPPEYQWPRIHPIVQISHVCRQWRDSALSNPMLWISLDVANISLPRLRPEGEPDLLRFVRRMGRLADMLPVLISRAGGFPLTLTIHAEDPTSRHMMPAYAESVLPVLNALRDSRWGKICLRLAPRYQDSPLLDLLQLGAQSRESLRYASLTLFPYGDPLTSEGDIIDHLNLDNTGQLSGLHLNIARVSLLKLRIRWGSITELSLSAVPPARGLLEILAQCPNLTRFTATVAGFVPPPHPQEKVTLSHLHSLSIAGEIGEIAHGLVLPSLSFFKAIELPMGGFDTSIPQCLRSYGSQLQKVAFSYDRLAPPTLLNCLKNASSVISLEIGPCPFIPSPGERPMTNKAFSHLHQYALYVLTVKQDDSGAFRPVCPKLENIIVHAPDVNTEVEEWAEFLASRRRSMEGAAAFLKSAEIRLPPPGPGESVVAPSMHDRVCDELAKRGVKIQGIKFLVEESPVWSNGLP
ncbi:hypothetical protein FA13DRAFT_1745471 [Coprinellus micaceus]|uniref:F-box domain-containing protein n=1 Tax=Coprinellus micaceus TaxID=71717 RepID=A0A4Y7SBM1_COPMI|nr:hypothetical protein FA13DRAFT_1745471 [Coprinellus micaceus]